MYSSTSRTWDLLSVNAAYPSCHAKLPMPGRISFIQPDEPPLISCNALLADNAAGMPINKCSIITLYMRLPVGLCFCPTIHHLPPVFAVWRCSIRAWIDLNQKSIVAHERGTG